MFESKQKIIIFLVFIFSLFLLSGLTKQAQAANNGMLRVGWTAPTTNEDETALTDLAGFIVYYGTASQVSGTCPTLTYNVASPYDSYLNVGNSAATSQVVSSLKEAQTYYFAVVAYDSSHNLSDCATVSGSGAKEVSKKARYRSDINLDSVTDELDFSLFHSYFGTSHSNEDINGDGTVDELDYSIIHSEWGSSSL